MLGGQGADIVKGGGGDDTIVAGDGDYGAFAKGDAYFGGSGNDTVDYSGMTAGVIVDLAAGSAVKTYLAPTAAWEDTGLAELRDFGSGSRAVTYSPLDVLEAFETQYPNEAEGVIYDDEGSSPQLDAVVVGTQKGMTS